MPSTPLLLTLPDLVAAVAALLTEVYEGVSNGRVRDLPDVRTIRWYRTLGLLDRPTESRGRAALYGRRHLLQIAAIKKLQAVGFTLEQIQGSLAGRTEEELARTLGLRLHAVDAAIGAVAASREAAARVDMELALKPPRRDGPFWKTRSLQRAADVPATGTAPDVASEQPVALQSSSLGGSAVVLWNGRPLSPSEQARLVDLSAPLVAFLSSIALAPAEREKASSTVRPEKRQIP